jgi:hypothetical protein
MVSPQMLGDCVQGITLSRLFFIIASCQKALIKKILHGKMPHECSFKIGALFGRALAFVGIFGPFLLAHIGFCPMVFMSTATHPKQEQKANEATCHVVRGPWLGKRA